MLPSEEVAFHKPLLFSRQPVDQKSSHASTRYLHTLSQVSYFFDNRVPSGSSLTPTPSQETRRRTRSLSPIKASGHMSGQPWLLRPHHYLVMKVKKVTAHPHSVAVKMTCSRIGDRISWSSDARRVRHVSTFACLSEWRHWNQLCQTRNLSSVCALGASVEE